MKRSFFLILLLTLLSILSGYLLSKATWISRVGMSLFYQQYNFLKIWWKGALMVFGILMLLFIIQTVIQKKLPHNVAKATHTILLIGSIVGLYFTYQDFRQHFSHRLLGERFHVGFYLFWLGWMIICCFYIFQLDKHKKTSS